jgi:hypothetical protein
MTDTLLSLARDLAVFLIVVASVGIGQTLWGAKR